MVQTRRRVLDGEIVPASEKLVSLFEPHADIIAKGGLPSALCRCSIAMFRFTNLTTPIIVNDRAHSFSSLIAIQPAMNAAEGRNRLVGLAGVKGVIASGRSRLAAKVTRTGSGSIASAGSDTVFGTTLGGTKAPASSGSGP
jgi:hypothetical protein